MYALTAHERRVLSSSSRSGPVERSAGCDGRRPARRLRGERHHRFGAGRVRPDQAGHRRPAGAPTPRCSGRATTPPSSPRRTAGSSRRTDLLVENRHFRRDWSTANDIGHKAAARNFADIVAMGAVPTALLVGFAAPGDARPRLGGRPGGRHARGVRRGRRGRRRRGRHGCRRRSRSASPRSATCRAARPVTLDGARPGDVVAVAGRLGWAAAGFAVLGRGFRSPVQVVNAHRRPEPPYAEGPRAAELGATAMTDVSDGLVADLGHIAEASGVRIDLQAALLDIPAKLARGRCRAQRRPAGLGADRRRRLRAGRDVPEGHRPARHLARDRRGRRGRGRAGGRPPLAGRRATSTSAEPARPRAPRLRTRSRTCVRRWSPRSSRSTSCRYGGPDAARRRPG